MTALVVAETAVLLLLGLLVAGLLRSHAEILRALHELRGVPLGVPSPRAGAANVRLGKWEVWPIEHTGLESMSGKGGNQWIMVTRQASLGIGSVPEILGF